MFHDFLQSKNVRGCLFAGIAMMIFPLLTSRTTQAYKRALVGSSVGIVGSVVVYVIEKKKKK